MYSNLSKNNRIMKFTKKVKKVFKVKYLKAKVGARYWDDSKVNGVEDEIGSLIPCRVGDYWEPLIDLETGKIINWNCGVEAEIHYKSCDNNTFQLLDEDENIVAEIEGYVIDMMCPKEEGYGDYVIMSIDSNGLICDWKVDLKPFK
jgi:hypothetical protein